MLSEFGHQWGYAENPLEHAIFPPAAPRVSAVASAYSAYTENSSFPYTRVQIPSHRPVGKAKSSGPVWC